MTIQGLLFSSPLLVLLGLVFGLGLSFRFRREPWIVFVWFPTVATFIFGMYLILQRRSTIGKLHGPDAGFAGMEVMYLLLPAFGLCVAGLVACFFCRPRKEAWHISTAVSALIVYSTLLFLGERQSGSDFEIQLLDASGNPLPAVRVQYSLGEGGLGMKTKLLSSDSSGKFGFRVGHHQSAELQIMPRPSSPTEVNESPTFWNLGIRPVDNSTNQFAARHSWQRPVGNVTLNEGFAEIIPITPEIHIELTLPPHESLDPAPRREKIRAALASFHRSIPTGLNYGYVCRNVEAIEFIPLLIEIYHQNDKQRGSVIEGLAQIAEILSDLEKGCREVQKRIGSNSHYPRNLIANQVEQLCIWAEIPDNSRSDVLRALVRVQERIAAHAGLLLEFAIEEMARNHSTLKILSELRQLAHPTLPRLVATLLMNPPKDMQSALEWSSAFWMMEAGVSDLEPLLNSGNQMLIACARDARPNR